MEGLSLDAFAGPDGLVLLLSMIARQEYPTDQLIELAKRLHLPGYEESLMIFQQAVGEGVVAPAIAPGYHLQCEIQEVLTWAARKLEDPLGQ